MHHFLRHPTLFFKRKKYIDDEGTKLLHSFFLNDLSNTKHCVVQCIKKYVYTEMNVQINVL